MKSPALLAKNLQKTFGPLRVVDGVSLQIDTGECLALLGPNGAGKTTTIEMLEGLTAPDKGSAASIEVFGRDFIKYRQDLLHRIGVVPQHTYVYKKLTPTQAVDLFGSFYHQTLPTADVIKSLGLEDKAHVRIEKLSGGQKQRLFLGCALVSKPDLLFLDEPTTGLDPQARLFVWDILLQAKKQRELSLLLTTHSLEEAERLADRVAIMDSGKIICCGKVQDLVKEHCLDRAVKFYIKTEIRDFDKSPAMIWLKQQGWQYSLQPMLDKWELSLFLSLENFDEKLSKLRQHFGEDFEVRPSRLEDVFIFLTGRCLRS